MQSFFLQTARQRVFLRQCGALASNTPVVFLHGNSSSGTFWEPLMKVLEQQRPEIHALAPDLNGFGRTEFRPIQAATGVADWAADIIALLDGLELDRVHLVCSSLGGIVGWRLLADFPGRLQTLTQIAPGSPYGFGGTHGAAGIPNAPDFAGSGAGMTNPQLLSRFAAGDRTQASPRLTSPAWLLQEYLLRGRVKIGPHHPLLDAFMSARLSEDGFPGRVMPSVHWPGYAPGETGILNSISPKYLRGLPEAVLESSYKPPVLWLRGDEDQVVSDVSSSDPAVQGRAGLISGYPGEEQVPPQPMLRQTRRLLEDYTAAGGFHREELLAGTGHCPYVEAPEMTAETLLHFWKTGR
jgi:pimeloyl-ACP methyl ester carboxylesterase